MSGKHPRCPKCKSRNIELIELWTAYILWNPEELYYNEGVLTPGDPYAVEGNCLSCGHKWRIRKFIQVQPEWFEEE